MKSLPWKSSWKKLLPLAVIFVFLVSSFSTAGSLLPSAYAVAQPTPAHTAASTSSNSVSASGAPKPNSPTPPNQLYAYGMPLSYFGMMSKDGTISTLESNYPSWNTYQSGSISSSSLGVNIDAGLNASLIASSGWADKGLVNSQLLSFPSSGQGETLSFQIMSGQEGRVVLASTYTTGSTEIFSTANWLDFCVCENTPQIKLDSSSNILWSSGSQSSYAAWSVRIGAGGIGMTAFVNTGTGWTEVYNSATLNIGFDYGYLYAFSRSTSTSTSTAMFGYLNVWNPNNPLVEGTLDQNVWYLVRHYESINSFSYAVMLDTSVPPVWMSIPDGTKTADMYVGMTLGGLGNECQGNLCNVVQGVLSTNGSTQTDAYLFCYGGACSSSSLQSVETGGSLSSPEVAYVTVETSPSLTGGSENYNVHIESSTTSFTLYLGTTQIFADSGSAGSGSYQETVAYGLPGLRYVSRHVTPVSGMLFQELGYNMSSNNWASPLENFMPAVVSACSGSSSCTSPYVEYYTPMFPSMAGSLASNWYYQGNPWPGNQFYADLPDAQGTTFGFPVFGNQWSDPYISRMSLTAPPALGGSLCAILLNAVTGISCNAQSLWINGVQQHGYDPTSLALRAMLAAEQGQSASTVESLLASTGWDGLGLSKEVSFFGVPYTQTAYATYETATFLAAASAVGNIEGSSVYSSWAAQAAGVLETALWSGEGHITGNANPVTLWQYAGGEMSAYNPSAAVLTYTSNQGGTFGAISTALQQIGYQGVQQAESPGFEPVATEATALSAVALLDYLSYLANLPAQRVAGQGPFFAAASSSVDTTTSCTPNTSYCTSSDAVSGKISFKTSSGGGFTADLQQPAAISHAITSSNWKAGFWIDGQITSGTLNVGINLMDPVTGNSITGYSTTLTTSQSYNQFVEVGGLYPLTLGPGSYLEQFIISGQGVTNFYDSGGFVQPLFLNIVPNTIADNFVQDQSYAGWWNHYATSNVSPCSITQGGDGLVINTASSNLAASACGIGSQSAVTAVGGNFVVQGQTSISSNGIGGTTANILLTPSLLGDGIENGQVATGTLVSSANNYIMLQEIPSGTGYEPSVSYCGLGTCSSHTGSSSSTNSTEWLVTFNPVSGNLNVATNSGSGYQQFYSTTSIWNTTSMYLYLYGGATSNSASEAAFQGVSIQGTSAYGLASNTGDINQFTTSGNPPSTTFYNFGVSGSTYLSSGAGTDFNAIQTVAFWMAPQTTGGNNNPSGSSTFVVSDVGSGSYGCCAGWAIEYFNNGALSFDYNLGGWNVAISSQTFPASSGPYFVTGVYNPSTNYIYLYVNGALVASKSTTGSPLVGMAGQLIIGASQNCVSGNPCYGGYLKGSVYGLTISTDTPASQQQVTTMMQYQAGDPIGSAYWYPLEDGSAADRFGTGPVLSWNSGTVNLLTAQKNPYLVPASTWTPYFGNGASGGSPYYTTVGSSDGSPPTSLEVYENTASTESCYNNCYGGFASQIDTSLWKSSNGLSLTFDYRATSSYLGSSAVTNVYVVILGASGTTLLSNLYTVSNTGDSGWSSMNLNIGPYVSGQQRITVFLGIDNKWSANYKQGAWFDNIRVAVPNQPSSSALQLYEQNSQTFQSKGYVTLPWYSPPSSASTVSVWFEPQTVNPGDNPRIVANDHTDSNNHGFEIYFNNGGSGVTFAIGSGTSTTSLTLNPTGGLESYAFYNAQMTYDGNGFCAYLYNAVGALLSSNCVTAGGGYSLSSGQYPVWIGENPQYQGDQFPGTVRDLRIFTYALSGAQSQALASDGPLSYSFAPNSPWMPLSGSFQDQISGLYGFPVNTNSMQFISEASQPSEAVQLTILTEFTNGTQIQGLYTVIYSASGSTILDTGYSPFIYPATSGDTYQVQVDNYGNYVFSNWAGGSTNDPITVQPSETMTLIAYYTYT